MLRICIRQGRVNAEDIDKVHHWPRMDFRETSNATIPILLSRTRPMDKDHRVHGAGFATSGGSALVWIHKLSSAEPQCLSFDPESALPRHEKCTKGYIE